MVSRASSKTKSIGRIVGVRVLYFASKTAIWQSLAMSMEIPVDPFLLRVILSFDSSECILSTSTVGKQQLKTISTQNIFLV